jgi:hypothetical protein
MFEDAHASSIALGMLSLFTALLASVQMYFKWSARSTEHRIAAIQWSRLYRFLSIEMSLPRNERKTPDDLLKDSKDTVDRLQEISPLIPPDIIELFKKNFSSDKDISKPEEANGLEKITIYTENPMRKNSLHIDARTTNKSDSSREQTQGQENGTPTIQAFSPTG